MADLLPLFVNLAGRRVVLVGGGRVAAAKLPQLVAAGAHVTVIAPAICDAIATQARLLSAAPARRRDHRHIDGAARPTVQIVERPFTAADLDAAWLAVAAATPAANREVADAAAARHVFVNAVDDPANATAFLSGVVRRDGVTIAISTNGDAPALAALLREGVDALLPRDLGVWLSRARSERAVWKRDAVPMDARKPRLLHALNTLYAEPRIPWLHAPEDSWL
jgi:uroporphyrin-III C-methyltransferase / precorrin-2 dehydrogenase / sirohydrochlorin ferrochelatase